MSNPRKVPFHGSEEIKSERGSNLDRIRVSGGWLYRTVQWDPDNVGPVTYSVALCFVPDPSVGT